MVQIGKNSLVNLNPLGMKSTLFFLIFAGFSSAAFGKLVPVKNPLKTEALGFCLLKSGSTGSLVPRSRPESELYSELNYQFNPANYTIHPYGFFVPKNVKEVSDIIRCCRRLGIRLVPKSGGHSYMKYSFGDEDTLVVDLRNFNQVLINREESTAEIGPGLHGGQVTYKLVKEGFVLPVGECPEIGITGYSLGGGISYIGRMYGMNTDSVLELEMVDARGNVLKINKDTNPDLFFANRGGGGGNFGIVTKFKFRIYKKPAAGIVSIITYPVRAFQKFYKVFQSWASGNPPRQYMSFFLFNQTGLRFFLLQILNETELRKADPMENFNQVLSSFPKPTKSSVKLVSYEDLAVMVASNFSGSTNITKFSDLYTAIKFRRERRVIKSFFVDKVLNPEELGQYSKLIVNYVEKYKGLLLMEMMGGATADPSPTDTAFVHRKKSIMYSLQVKNENKDPAEIFRRIPEFYDASKLILNHTETYQNYLEPGMADFLERFYGQNLQRLIKIKSKIDPDNFFRNPLTIPVMH